LVPVRPVTAPRTPAVVCTQFAWDLSKALVAETTSKSVAYQQERRSFGAVFLVEALASPNGCY
jgi:hypothetical protein